MYKASRALAALDGRDVVQRADLRTAAEFVLPHRRRRQPFQQPGLDREAIDRMLGPDEGENQDGPEPTRPPDARDEDQANSPEPQSSDSPDSDESGPAEDVESRVIDPGDPVEIPPLDLDPFQRIPSVHPGTHAVKSVATRGVYIRAIADPVPRELAVDATLRAAARRGGLTGSLPTIERGDLHGKQRQAQSSTLILFVVDTSGSMGARKRMEAVKAAVLSLLGDAYQRRDRVAAIAFRGPRAEVVLAPSRSVDLAESALRQLPTGGRTPLAHALTLAADLIEVERKIGPSMVVLLTDGKANVAVPGSECDPWQQALAAAQAMASTGASAVVFDTEEGFGRTGRAAEVARAMGAEILPLAGLSADTIRSRIDPSLANGGRS